MNNTDRQRQLKKRLFILAGYLFITAILLVYLSYSSYRIKIETTVLMPRTYTMSASLGIDYNESLTKEDDGYQNAKALTTAAVTLEDYNALVGLAPGKNAETYALQSGDDIKESHKFSVTINNMDVNGTSPCALDLYYTLEVETAGRLPLSFVIEEDGTITGSAVVDCTENEQTTSAIFVSESTHEPLVYKLEAGETLSENTHNIYIGWNDDSPRAADIDLCREVDKITIRAKIYAAAPEGQESKTDIIIYDQEEIVNP